MLAAGLDPDMDGVASAFLRRRFNEVGPHIIEKDRDYYRGVAGFTADLAPQWTLDGYYSYGRNETTERLENSISRTRLRQGLPIDPVSGGCLDPSGDCVPVNIFGPGNISADAAAFIRNDGLQNSDRSVQHVASLAATGDVFDWSGGTVQGSFGAEFRRNAARFIGEPGLNTGDAIGFNPFDSVSGSINVYEFFGEALIPLLTDHRFADRLEIEAGGRWSHYSTAGGVWTWKAGGQWRPTENLRFTGMWQRAIRAPNVEELFSPTVSDPVALVAPEFTHFRIEHEYRHAVDHRVRGVEPARAFGLRHIVIGIVDLAKRRPPAGTS